MKFVLKLVFSRARKRKVRLALAILAIAASSCLVVWTIGGFQALFIDATSQDADYLGSYDLRLAVDPGFGAGFGGRGGGSFGAPYSRQNAPEKSETKTEAKPASRGDGAAPPEGRRGGRRGGRGGLGGPGAPGAIPAELIMDLRADESTLLCDETSTLRAFVYSPGAVASILQDADAVEEEDKPTIKRALELTDEEFELIGEAPQGVDPALHRAAFGAFRATMGTPMGLGSTFLSTTASDAPYELEDGRWFNVGAPSAELPREAVVTTKGNERLKARVGDSLLIIDGDFRTGSISEYQLKVVGIAKDSENDGFYISRDLALELFGEERVETSGVYLKLRGDPVEFRARWSERFAKDAPGAKSATEKEIAEQRAAAFRNDRAFKYQAISGTLLASLAALLIVFTTLNMSLEEDRRLIAFYRIAGLARSQIGLSVLLESALIAVPGWAFGALVGWVVVWIVAGKWTGLNVQTIGLSFVCACLGAIFAALYPMIRSLRVRPLEAFGELERSISTRKAIQRRRRRVFVASIVGALAIFGDLWIVGHLPKDAALRAALHSSVGTALLALGGVCLLPLALSLVQFVVVPPLAALFRVESRTLRRELSGNSWRVVAVAVALSVGGGLFVTMQIWGYSMLDPFLPGRRSPDAFVAFLPTGLRPEIAEELKKLPWVDENRFVPIAIDQAAFAEGSVPDDERKRQFANVVFFGVDVGKAFEGREPLVGFRFRQGNPKEAFDAMKNGRGVIVTDSLSIDYGLNRGDSLKVVDPRDAGATFEYPIVGVVSFPGWQWLSKTGGVRRNFGRSGGIAFAREGVVASDFQIERRSYFWFDAPEGEKIDYATTELACDFLARKNLALDLQEGLVEGKGDFGARTAYAKLSTRDSLTESITKRADSVIWALSKIPITTLIIASIAVVGAISNSVRARRWRYGVMRAVGSTRGAIARAVLVEALVIAIVASMASFAFGFLAARGVLKLGESIFGTADPPIVLPLKGLSLGLGLTAALCLVAALYPAIKTGRTEILKLLQSGRALE
ncbi:MAG: ABC transporter permease [Thermoguttaceae bacterium]|nr:ABC transporter permease [Thermoguttaceae bacterium]